MDMARVDRLRISRLLWPLKNQPDLCRLLYVHARQRFTTFTEIFQVNLAVVSQFF
jgi:hypothetical protein